MPDQNPFEKKGSDDVGDVLPPGAKVCPVFGLQTMVVPTGGIVRNQMPQLETKISYPACVGDHCMVWDEKNQCCSLKSASMILEQIRVGLAPLKNFFGGK